MRGRSTADFSVSGTVMFLLRFSLGHVFTLLGVAVPARSGAVVHARSGIHPDSDVRITFSGLRDCIASGV